MNPFEFDDDDSVVDQDKYEINKLDEIIPRKLVIKSHHPSMNMKALFDHELAVTSCQIALNSIPYVHPYSTLDKGNPFYLPSIYQTPLAYQDPSFLSFLLRLLTKDLNQKCNRNIEKSCYPTNLEPSKHVVDDVITHPTLI